MTQTPMIEADIARHIPTYIKAELAKFPLQKQSEFLEEFNRKRRSTGLAYLCWFFGLHYAYLKSWGMLVVYWISLLAIVGLIWAIVDAFRLPGMLENYNKDLSVGIMRDMKLATA